MTHEVDKWEVTGGNPGDTSVKVKITANTTVKVTFKKKDTTPVDKTYTVGAVGFTMKVIAAVDASLGHNDYSISQPHTVFELSWDWYDDTLPASPEADYAGPDSGSNRVWRGGCKGCFESHCTVGVRGSDSPVNWYNSVGLRLACLP